MAVLVVLTLLGCGGAPDSTPDGAVRELVRLLGDDSYEPGSRERAFGLLDARARRDLARRAREASDAAGRPMKASDMLVPGGTTFLFDVRELRVVEERGASAVVEVIGAGREKARIRVVRESGRWRVVLPLGGVS